MRDNHEVREDGMTALVRDTNSLVGDLRAMPIFTAAPDTLPADLRAHWKSLRRLYNVIDTIDRLDLVLLTDQDTKQVVFHLEQIVNAVAAFNDWINSGGASPEGLEEALHNLETTAAIVVGELAPRLAAMMVYAGAE